MENTEIITTNNFANESEFIINSLTDVNASQYCSMVPKTEADEAILFNAMNNPAHRLADEINTVIEVKDIFCEAVECEAQDGSGNKNICPRIVLIDTKGEGHTAVSVGIYSALKKVFAIKGTPDTWSKPCKLKVVQVTRGEKKMLTLNMV